MKTAQQLQQESFQAYQAFRSVPANVTLITSLLIQIATVADAAAHLGGYTCNFDLGNSAGSTGNSQLFQKFLTDELNNLGYAVTFGTGVGSMSVSLDWTVQDDF